MQYEYLFKFYAATYSAKMLKQPEANSIRLHDFSCFQVWVHVLLGHNHLTLPVLMAFRNISLDWVPNAVHTVQYICIPLHKATNKIFSLQFFYLCIWCKKTFQKSHSTCCSVTCKCCLIMGIIETHQARTFSKPSLN